MSTKSKILLCFIAILAGYSFSSAYNTYVEMSLQNNLIMNNEFFSKTSYQYEVDVEEIISNYENMAREENFVLFSIENSSDGQYIYYYDPTLNTEFMKIVDNYEKQCYQNCIIFVEQKIEDFSIGTYDIEVFSEDTITRDIYDKYNIDVEEIVHHSEDHSDNFNLIRYHYYSTVITAVLTIFMMICILIIELISNIKKINLYSVYGYSYKTLIGDWNKSYIMFFLIIYLVIFNVVCLLIVRNVHFIKYGFLYSIFIFLITYITFLITTYYFYTKIRKVYHFRFLKSSIIYFGTILSILTVLSLYFVNTTINYYKISSDANEAFDINKNYYYLNYDLSLNEETQAKIAKDLIDNHSGIYRQYAEIELGKTPILFSDYSIFSENGYIYDINGELIIPDESKNILYYTDESALNNLSNHGLNIDLYEKMQIRDNGEEYITLSPFVSTVKLKDIVLIIVESDALYISNVYIKSESKLNAEELFSRVFIDHGINSDVKVFEVGESQIKKNIEDKYTDNAISSIVSVISIVIANIFFTLLIFQKNKDKIIISNVLGYNYFNRMYIVIREFIITCLMSLIMMFIIGVYAVYLYVIIFIIQYIVFDLNIRLLTKKSLTKHLKGEMEWSNLILLLRVMEKK